ncbi:MAG: hypothetical protein GY866_34100, partial [Proteobacteria bacterium]|nr:hypothetical protein [Pseudomonadota bacterium]
TARDYLGRITRVGADLGGGRTYYRYNVAGNLTLIIDAKNNRTAFNWDSLGRKIFMFDDVLGNWKYKYDVSGNLIEVIDPRPDKTNEELANSVKYERDEMGRVVRETREIDLVPGLHTIEYDYDYDGKLTRLTYPDAYHVDYEYYPGSGLLKSVTGSDNRKFAEFSNYQPTGKPGRVDYGSGSHTIYTYDPTTQRIL